MGRENCDKSREWMDGENREKQREQTVNIYPLTFSLVIDQTALPMKLPLISELNKSKRKLSGYITLPSKIFLTISFHQGNCLYCTSGSWALVVIQWIVSYIIDAFTNFIYFVRCFQNTLFFITNQFFLCYDYFYYTYKYNLWYKLKYKSSVDIMLHEFYLYFVIQCRWRTLPILSSSNAPAHTRFRDNVSLAHIYHVGSRNLTYPINLSGNNDGAGQ